MPNIELLEKSMPVAPIRIAALGCRELAEEVDRKLVKFRKELVERKQLSVIPQGYSEESFIVECECPRFGTGEGKGYIKESVRGTDLYIMVDVTNYSESYSEKPANVKLLNYMPKDEYQLISDQCDVGMMFLDHRFTIPNFPSRILNYLASGNPVLAATDANTDIGTIARDNGFGFCCESNDVKGFAKAVDDFINADREVMGEKGWNFLKNNWSVENGYNIIMKHFG